ncbi:hypothetical protein SELR_18390 [Selenomonas ruminantium subsp. lactilytica TAM6421]|uniref:Uncharacterized protein n=1 Tax=Selenomonas ruminantium subsp. lactilytica (strain NBRC 103574 / TAM6421) TaxID=927704 RepID=I0GS10_SELRL|nr:hypothetical protein [Selenomonas ruminantium]BAL83547.1 hypothetical protein SELR_18390 [Selenomonas ruminantium subsp. lactilytica TAM6421]
MKLYGIRGMYFYNKPEFFVVEVVKETKRQYQLKPGNESYMRRINKADMVDGVWVDSTLQDTFLGTSPQAVTNAFLLHQENKIAKLKEQIVGRESLAAKVKRHVWQEVE